MGESEGRSLAGPARSLAPIAPNVWVPISGVRPVRSEPMHACVEDPGTSEVLVLGPQGREASCVAGSWGVAAVRGGGARKIHQQGQHGGRCAFRVLLRAIVRLLRTEPIRGFGRAAPDVTSDIGERPRYLDRAARKSMLSIR